MAKILQDTQTCLVENGNEICKDLYRTCTAIVLLIKPSVVWRRSRCRCRRGLPKFPTIPPATALVCLKEELVCSQTFE